MPDQSSVNDIQDSAVAPVPSGGQMSVDDLHENQPTPTNAYERLLNAPASHVPYVPGSQFVQGMGQGALKGVNSTAIGTADLVNNMFSMGKDAQGNKIPLWESMSPEKRALLTQPNQPGQGTGKFLEQAAEFAVPGAVVGDAIKGMPLAARLLSQAGLNGAVSAAQSGGDPLSTGLGVAMGAGSELAGAGISAVKGLASQPLAGTLENFRDAFAATPVQLPKITRALKTMAADGITPADDVNTMQQAIKGRLADLGQQYQTVNPVIASREIPVSNVVADLEKLQRQYVGGTKVTQTPSTMLGPNGKPIMRTSTEPIVSAVNSPGYSQLAKDIQTAKDLADQNGGKLTFANLKYLRDGANDATNWTKPDAEQNLYRDLGDTYRKAMDNIAPETTELNRKYSEYKGLESVIDRNISMGRGQVESRFSQGINQGASHTTGAMIGGIAGHSLGPVGGSIGAAVGSAAWPKLTAPVVRALKNAQDAGLLAKASAPAKAALQAAMRTGIDENIMRAIGGLTKETALSTVNPR
jgi:hypothetical protein